MPHDREGSAPAARRRVVMLLVWLAGVAIAVSASVTAVGVVGERVTSRQIVTRDETADAPAEVDEPFVATTAPGADDPAATATTVAGAGTGGATGTGSSGSGGATGGGGGGSGSAPVATTAPSGPSATAPPATQPATGSPQSDTSSTVVDGTTTTTAAPAAVAVDEVHVTSGGTVAVRCTGDQVSLLYATPTSGFELDGAPAINGRELDVRFREVSGSHEARVRVSCVGGSPDEKIEER